MEKLTFALAMAKKLTKTPNELARLGLKINQDGVRRNVIDVLGYPGIDMAKAKSFWPELGSLNTEIAEQIEITGVYSGYLNRQEADIKAFRSDESLVIPDDIVFEEIGGLSNEICMKLTEHRPSTLGAAARISGVTPAALTALLGFVRRKSRAAA